MLPGQHWTGIWLPDRLEKKPRRGTPVGTATPLNAEVYVYSGLGNPPQATAFFASSNDVST
jgi:hypothetical protein